MRVIGLPSLVLAALVQATGSLASPALGPAAATATAADDGTTSVAAAASSTTAGGDVLASDALIPTPHLKRVTRALLDKARLEKARAAYQRTRESHYRAQIRRSKSAHAKRQAKFKLFEARTKELRARAKAQELKFRLKSSGSYRKWRRSVRFAKEYNHLRGFKGKRFDIRPCLRLCKSLDDKTCYKGCYRMAYKRLLKIELVRMVKLYPKDGRYNACATNAYDFELLVGTINAKRERRAHASTSSSRNLDHERVTGGNGADINAALATAADSDDDAAAANVDRVYVGGVDPSWTRIAHESVERTLTKAMPAISGLDDDGDDNDNNDNDINNNGGGATADVLASLSADRDWNADWSKTRAHNTKAHWTRQLIKGMERDTQRRAADANRKSAAMRGARQGAVERLLREKIADERRHKQLRDAQRGIAGRERREATREASAAAAMQAQAERRATRSAAQRMALRKVTYGRASREIEAHAMRVARVKARAMGYRHQHELSDFLHEARNYNERCLRAAQRRAKTSRRSGYGGSGGSGKPAKPINPLHDKDLIYRMTLDTSKKMIRRWLLYWRALKRHKLHEMRARHDARQRLGDDDDIPGHLERSGQGPPHWLFDKGLAAPAPDRIAVSKFVGHKAAV
jgi:hypothetical protein